MPDFFGHAQPERDEEELAATLQMAGKLSDWERMALMLAMQGGAGGAEIMDDGYDELVPQEETETPRSLPGDDFWL